MKRVSVYVPDNCYPGYHTTITIQPCLLGFAVDPEGWAPGIYETFGEVLWFLLNFPGEYVVVLK